MSGWQMLAWCAVCALGILIFLVPVACEIEISRDYLRLLCEAEEKAIGRRKMAQIEVETVAKYVA